MRPQKTPLMRLFWLLFFAFTLTGCATTNYSQRADVQGFMLQMHRQHGFEQTKLCTIFSEVKPQPSIVKTITKPQEGKTTPWYTYRAIFITPARAKEGARFWHEHEKVLAKVSKQYGVPAEIIVAIIGIETRYGQNEGDFRVIDALTNLAFDYPRRSDYFRSELEQYLLLTREQHLDPLEPTGSYAGAIGEPQFMPSSYRRYGIDFSGGHHADLCHNPADAIASVGNYFHQHGWKTGEAVAVRVKVTSDDVTPFITQKLKPVWSLKELTKHGITPESAIVTPDRAVFMSFEGKTATEYWLGFTNFYVITRYNSSRYYAMAVYQLAQAIVKEKK